MAASSPSSVIPDPEIAPTPRTGLAPPRGTSRLVPGTGAASMILPAEIPLRFMVTGMVCLLAGSLGIIVWPDVLATYHYNQRVLAITHLVTLGWLGSVVMGAMYQLVPVALETQLHNVRLARWHFHLHAVGLAGMVAMFWVWNMKQVGHFGSIVALGMGLFIYNLTRSIRRIERWTPIAAGIASALAWLGATALAGLYVACAKCWQFSPFDPFSQMHAHAHLGVIGFFLMTLVAVSLRLIPMFCLGTLVNVRRAWWTIGLLNAGVLAVFISGLLGSRWRFAAGLLTVTGLGLYAIELSAILRSRKRRALDWGLRAFFIGVALIAPVAVLGLFLSRPGLAPTEWVGQLENAYGLLALLGILTLPIVGMLHKIVPFLVWQSVYSPLVGSRKVPLFTDLYSTWLLKAAVILLATGLAAITSATLLGSPSGVRWAGTVFAAGTLAFIVDMTQILRHLVRPEPLDPSPASQQPPTAAAPSIPRCRPTHQPA